MMKKLITGEPASKLFRDLMERDASIDADVLGGILMDEFPDISPAINICINRWQRANAQSVYPDEQLDAMILAYLKDAGYVAE